MTYNFSPPNFCGKCGNKISASFSPQASSASSVKKLNVSRRVEEENDFIEDEDEFSSFEEVPQIQSLAYELENDSGCRQYQLGELFGQQASSSRKNRSMSVDDFKERHGKKD